jgi:putative flippase GtrA
MPVLAIIIPVYNEAENIRQAIARIKSDVFIPYTISIIYDMEEDTTIPVVKEIQHDMKNLTLVKNKYGRGVLNAIKTGFETMYADCGEYIVVTMADLSDPPSVINKMYKIAEEEGADVVCASRYMKGGMQEGGPFMKGFLSRMAGLSLHCLAGVPTHDATNNFKLYKTSFLKKVSIESNGGFELGIELVAKAHVHGYKICETPTEWIDRVAGKSNFKLLQWLPSYLNWYFYAFEKQPQTASPLVATIMKYRGQFIKYAVSGLICAFLNWLAFYLLHYLCHIYYLISASLAFFLSVTANYFLSKLIFASRQRKKSAEFLLVFMASAIALSLDLFVMYFLVDKIGIPAMAAKILGTGSAFAINYLSRQFFIFKSKI